MPQARSSEYLSPQPYFGERDDIELYFPDGTWCNNDGKNKNSARLLYITTTFFFKLITV